MAEKLWFMNADPITLFAVQKDDLNCSKGSILSRSHDPISTSNASFEVKFLGRSDDMKLGL